MAVILGGVATFALVASIIQPGSSTANPRAEGVGTPEHFAARMGSLDRTGSDPSSVVRSLVSLKHPRGWPLLGALAGTDYIVLVHGPDEGARYSVFTTSGKLMQADLASDDVYRVFPTLDLPGARLEPDGKGEAGEPIMMILPEHD